MFISRFSVEDWQGTQNHSSIYMAQEWRQIESAINELDGQRKTLVTLEADRETHMAIGGGKDRFIVYLTFDNESFYYPVASLPFGQEETLVVGGQEGIYPSRLCITKELALKVAKSFAERGAMDQSVTWEREGVAEPV